MKFNRPFRLNRRTLRRSLIALTATFLIGSVLTEVALRLGLGLGHPLLYVPDRDCGYLPKPSQDLRRFGARIEINSIGCRSEPLAAIKPSNELRLLILGDSVTFGTTRVDQSQIFTTRLEQVLAKQLARPVEVINASAGGWAVGNEVAFVKSRGTFDADTMLLVLNTGDLVQPFNTLKPIDALNYPQQPPPLAIVELFTRYVGPRLFHTGGGAADAGSIAAAATDAVNELAPVLAAIDGVREQALSAHARLILVFIPARSGDWEQPGYAAALLRLKEWTTQHFVPIWDLTPEMTARPIGELYQDGIHPTAAGHAVIAERLAREIAATVQ